MIKRRAQMQTQVREHMRGGEKNVRITNILEQGEYQGNARMIAQIVLEPGASIGEHVHDNEEEVFYILDGEAVYNDNGREEILMPGDSCVCLGSQKHAIRNASEEDTLRMLAIILTYSL